MMDIITLDAETYFDKDYTLSKLTTEAYCRDQRFEVLGWGIREQDGSLQWLTHNDAKAYFKTIPWNDIAVLAHHAHFDLAILNWTYGYKPKCILDTLSMARQVVGNHLPKGLDALAKHYNLPAKTIPYDLFKGKHWYELDAVTQRQVSEGCLHDVNLTWQIFNLLAKEFPKSEYPLVDMTIRMFTEPMLVADLDLFGKLWLAERDRKQSLLTQLGVTAKQLGSADQFADLLRARGIEPETKDGKNGSIYAFAKTDQFMRDLEDGEDEYICNLVRARLGVRSTIIQARVERLGNMGARGSLAPYLAYCGAHTTRWSGGDKTNWQNFKRGHAIRDAIKAPDGFVCAVVDASQIECRILNCFAGQTDILQAFRDGEDIYCRFASGLYGRKITKSDVAERGTGKQGELSLGYGSGAETFQRTARLGIYGPPVGMTVEAAEEAVGYYRTTHPEITRLWGSAGRWLARLASPDYPPAHIGHGCWLAKGRLYGPSGAWIDYSTLEARDGEWRFRKRDGWRRIWGGFLVENLIQFLARIHLAGVMKELQRAGVPKIALCTHDDIFALVRDDGDAQAWLDHMIELMSTPPAWMPEVPLAAEGHLGKTYGEAK